MNNTWKTVLAATLGTFAVLAELNLLRTLIRDDREGRRQQRLKRRGRRRVRTQAASRYRLAACAAVAGLAPASFAQEPVPPVQSEAPKAQAAIPVQEKSPYSLQLNFDITNAYFYHGIRQEDDGLIVQPAARATVTLFEREDFKIDGILGTWNSFHGEKTAATTTGDFTNYWYESDLYGGLAITKDKFTLTSTFIILTSPSDAYETVQELDFNLSYDDSELLGKFALHPYALLAVEVGADASDGANSNPGTYLELGITPGFSFDVDKTPVAISFPVSVGLSLSDYFQDSSGNDETIGFAQVGIKASLPLPLADRYGRWSLNAGISALFLGDNTASFNGGDHEQLIGTIGLQLNF